MTIQNTFFAALFALVLAPLACGPGNGNDPGATDMTKSSEKDDMATSPKMGTLVVNLAPMGKDMMVELEVDGMKMGAMPVGTSSRFTIPAGAHNVQIKSPGYGYAVHGYNWNTSAGPVSGWVISNLMVSANAETEIKATLCRDLTGEWNTPDGVMNVSIGTNDGKCATFGFSPINFEIKGDDVCRNSMRWTPILENGARIEYDMNDDGKIDYTFTKVSP